jgi:peptide/nickel transport system substrate-binding protein
MSMKRWFIVLVVALSMVILLSPCTPQAASPTASTTKKAATSSTKAKPSTDATASSTAAATSAAQPQTGGIWKMMMKTQANVFGYPPRIVGPDRDFAPPFFDRLLRVGDDGKYKPGLALSWDTSADGKTITFKLRQGVTFHDGTPFNAQAVKSNFDNLIPPKATILSGITSVEVVDDYTVRFNLPSYNNLIFYHLALNLATYMYSPEALKKNSADWATTHPVGTGPFMLKDFQPNTSLTLVKNPNYWDKGLPYLDGIEIAMVPDPMTQMLAFKAGQVHTIYSASETAAAQLRDAGYPLMAAPAGPVLMSFDIKNSEILSKPQVRQAIEYAIDKEAICTFAGQGLFIPLYQILAESSPDFNPACPPRKYNPAKAKQLLSEAGYPNGFSFKVFILDSAWKDGWVAAQSYLNAVGITMEISYLNVSAFTLIRGSGKIEKGAASFHSYAHSASTLFMLDTFWRSTSNIFQYVVKPAGIDQLIDQAKSSRDPAAVTKLNRQILKLIYDDQTVVPLWQNKRFAVVNKSVQNTGWFINGSEEINQFGTRTWLKK